MTRSRLGRVGATECWVARTDRPWSVEIDAIVLSAGGTLGSLGLAVRNRFPQAAWTSVEFDRIVPGRPFVLPLSEGSPDPSTTLSLAVIVTPHPGAGEPQPALDTIETATRAAVDAARQHDVRSLGMPLLATGVLGFLPAVVAEVAVPAAVGAAADFLDSLVFVCLDVETEHAIRRAWRQNFPVEPLHPRTSPEPGTTPVAAALHPGGEEAEPLSAELAGGVSADRVDANRGIPLDRDQLGVRPYVSMLATVIADRRTPLPLSVGVFGAWGSGKSYFMGMLRQRVADLAASGNPAYCATIEQIGFNAWHYADSNLWASLGDAIFRHLADDGAHPERSRQLLRTELAGQLSQRRALESATDQARVETAALKARIDQAVADRERCARGLIGALLRSSVSRRSVAGVWARLGLDQETEQGRLLAEEMNGTLDEVDALRRSPWNRRGRLVLAVAAVVPVVAAFAMVVAPAVREWVAAIGGGLFAALAGTGIAAVGAARSGLRGLRELAEELHAGAAEPELVDALRRAEADQRVAEAQLDEVVARVGELGRQLTELSPGRRLYSFLADRAQGDTYTSNLGLISTIRKDFEQLVDLMADWRRNPTTHDGAARQPIDRIVLYIDDLDRCGAQQVVAVLQAVHLLLALDLFVVVVGVDPRWLLRALSSHYDETLRPGGGPAPAATPEDYLEKILNIPLVLPGMGPGSLSNLLRSMIDEPPPPEPGPAPPPAAPRPPGRRPPAFPIESGSELDTQDTGRDPTPPRPLTGDELALLVALDPLVDTPRAAKRLMNLYRMLRSTRDLSEASHFLGDDGRPGEYQAVIVLLGLLTANARIFGQVMDTSADEETNRLGGLLHRPAGTPWLRFVDDLDPQRTGDTWTNPIRGPIADGDRPHWSRLHDGMSRLSGQVTLTDLELFQLWAPRVRRFCYVLSPTGT